MDILALQDRVTRRVLASFGAKVVLGDKEVLAEFLRPSLLSELDGVSAVIDRPQIVIADGDVPRHPVGEKVIIGRPHFDRETLFEIADARSDGRGMTTLMLEVP